MRGLAIAAHAFLLGHAAAFVPRPSFAAASVHGSAKICMSSQQDDDNSRPPFLKDWTRTVASSVLAGMAIGWFIPSVLQPQLQQQGIVRNSQTQPEELPAFAGAAKPLPDLADQENSYIKIFEQSTPGVVYISTFVSQRDAFSMNVMEVPAGTGSGFVWDKEGHIVTNFHVIRTASTAQVRLTDPVSGKQMSYSARVQGYDPDKDVAVLKIDAPKDQLRPVPLGSSGVLKVGQLALAIGNPFGLDHTLTTGVISGLGREVRSPSGRPISNVIQSDAAINPGNSGGPLLNSAGQIIGMNTAIYSPSGASAGVGFAIPIDTLKPIVGQIVETGTVTRPIIGITYLQSAQARALGIEQGVLVLDVPVGSAAEAAGLRGTARSRAGYIELGDIIRKIDREDINNEADLFKVLENKKPGDVIRVTILRTEMSTETQTEMVLSIKLQQSTQQAQALSPGLQAPPSLPPTSPVPMIIE